MARDSRRLPWWVRLARAPGELLKWLAGVGAAIVSPIERLFSRLFGGMMSISEGFEGLAVRIGWAILWPFMAIWRLLVWLAENALPKSVRNVLLAPFRWLAALGQWTIDAFMRLAELLNLDAVLWWLVRMTRPIWYPFAAFGGFVIAWWSTRRLKQLLWGLPLALVVVPILATMTWSKLWGSGRLATRYRVAVKAAIEDKDYERVRLFERKLAQLGVDTKLTDFNTATALAKDGKWDEAYDRMKTLAPEDAPGYPQAHFWIIQEIVLGKLDLTPEESHRVMGVHLDHLQTLGIKAPEVQLLKAAWLTQGNRQMEAIKVLEPIAPKLSQAAIARMRLEIELQLMEDARRDARLVRTHLEERVRRGMPVVADEYRAWTVAEELLGDSVREQEIVRNWLKLEPENPMARSILGQLSERQFNREIMVPDPDVDRLAKLFIEAAELSTDSRRLQTQVTTMYRLRAQFPAVKQVVERIMDSPQAPAPILEAIGTVAATQGDYDLAKEYLKRAIDKDPKNAVALNNYAFIVLTYDQANHLNEALDYVNRAIAVKPDEFRFRETRGQILVKLGKWNEAVADLEFASNGMPNSVEIHQSLATAYEALGEKQLARLHRQQSQ